MAEAQPSPVISDIPSRGGIQHWMPHARPVSLMFLRLSLAISAFVLLACVALAETEKWAKVIKFANIKPD
jgi:hypothetical protein